MPLIFNTEAPTLYESDYADITGVQYEFPERYRNLVNEGDRFVYYRGRRAGSETGYFGEGIVGTIGTNRVGHRLAQLTDVELFGEIVPIRDADDNYLETGATKGTNWANGVRRITDEQYIAIINIASDSDANSRSSPGFASPEHALAMERYSVDVVLSLLAKEFGADAVREMPVNNKGYDIEVVLPGGDLHVEVKGTILRAPVFHLSEGQRQHAQFKREKFRLCVVHSIDVIAKSHMVEICDGSQLAERANLRADSWTGILRSAQ